MTILPVRLLLKLDTSIIFLLKEDNFGLSILSKWHMAGKEADIEKNNWWLWHKGFRVIDSQGISADPYPPPKELMYQNWII